MSYIFGIVDFNGIAIEEKELQKLDEAVKGDGFASQTKLGDNYAIGFSHRPDRDQKCKIYKYQHLILLADLRIYNLDSLRSYFDFEDVYEAFVKSYLRWGVQCPNYINGDFAVVIIDQQCNDIHLIRDHIGARPLTYYYADSRLVFSSHEFGLVKSGLCRTQLSEENMLQRLFGFKTDYTQTAFQQIYKIVPGNVVSITKEGKKETTYWNPAAIKTNYNITFDEAVKHLRQFLIQATVARIEPGKTGVHVSGGLDSTGIACILADHIDDKSRMIGYSWTPEEMNDAGNDQNEKEFINAFSAEKGVPVRYLSLEKDELTKDSIIPEFENMPIEYPIIRMAGHDELTTLFSGWGGDEFLSLSTRGTFNHLFFHLKAISLFKMIQKFGIRSTNYLVRTELLPLLIPFGLLPSFRGTNWSFLRLLKSSLIRKHWKLILFHSRKNVYGYGSRKEFIMNLLKMYHIPTRIDTWAFYSEKYGFEYKYPLLDKDLLDFWFSLPVSFTYEKFEPRLLYREIMKGILTESIRVRKDKSETLRIKYTQQNRRDGKEYLEKLFNDIPKNKHLPYFNIKTYERLLKNPLPNKQPDCGLYIHKLCFYLRNVELFRKYLY
jgi:asparagine synthase (glutamine-hydrolysing)